MAGYSKTYTLDFTSSGDTVYTGTDKLEDNIDSIITWINAIKKNYASATAPTSPAPDEGQLWWDSTNDELHVYSGSAWGDPITDTYKVKADSGDGTEGYLNAKVQHSIAVDETNHKLQLSNDSSAPGNNYAYGTNPTGTKGWILNLLCGVSSNDSTPGYLNGKLEAGDNVTLTEGSDGSDETLTIASSNPDATSGNYVEAESNGEESHTGDTDYTKVKEFIVGRDGTYYVRFELKISTDLVTAYAKIYRDGVAVGTEKSEGTGNYTQQTDTVSGWSRGDLLQIYIKTSWLLATAYVKNVKVCTGNPITTCPHYDDVDTV